jgi:predicted house-cleaning noncanonical NTP pyrophosphatase (MazG superfamily)
MGRTLCQGRGFFLRREKTAEVKAEVCPSKMKRFLIIYLLILYMADSYAKLVRDRIPEIIRRDGRVPYTHRVSGSELESALWNKLDEEIGEFRQSGDTKEFADILEVIYALANFYGVKPSQLDAIRERKAEERGGFSQGTILDKIEGQTEH